MWLRHRLSLLRQSERAFVFDQCIGKGAFGAVYSGTHDGVRRAAKVIDTQKLSASDARLLENEIRIWSRLNHPNIVLMYDVQRSPQRCVIVCELLEGGSLRDRHVRMVRLGSKPRILTILTGLGQIATAMAHLHALGYIHRDLKSENVLLTADQDTLKVADFGLARLIEGDDKTAETGSYRHMAPEVIRHERYDSACDVYSFAMILYEMLTLSVPFVHYTPVDAALAVACRAERPPVPSGAFTPEVVALLTDCWAQNAGQRPRFATIVERVEGLKAKKSSFGSLQLARSSVSTQASTTTSPPATRTSAEAPPCTTLAR